MRVLFATSFVVSMLLLSPGAQGQAEFIAPAAGAVLERQLNADVDARIRQAEAAGEFATLNLLLRIKSALDAVRETGGTLISQASAAANQQSYQTYLQMRAAIKAPGDSIAQLESAAVQAQQIAENLPTGGGRTFIINYSPRVSPPPLQESVRLRLTGVNFDDSKPTAQLNGKPLKVQSLGMQELTIIVPAKMLSRRPDSVVFNDVKVNHLAKTSFFANLFGSKRIERTLPVVILPEIAGKIEVSGKGPVTRREYKDFTAAVSLAGYSSQRRIQLPGEGWKFDLEKPYDTKQGAGEAGTCYSVDRHSSTKDGIVVLANNSKYWSGLKEREGYVTCHLTAQVYREVTTTEDFKLQQYVLGWTKPVYIDLPHDRSSFIAKVALFDGTEEPVDGAKLHRYFESSLVGDQLRIEPRVPRMAD